MPSAIPTATETIESLISENEIKQAVMRGARNYFDECRANIPARVSPKQARNECAAFQPKIVKDLAADKGKMPQTPDDARKAFDALFKK